MRNNRLWTFAPALTVATTGLLGIALATAAPPAESPSKAPSTSSRLFAAEPQRTVETPSTAVPSTAATSAPSSADAGHYVKRLHVKFDSIEDADAKYDEYFKQHRVYPKVVRAEVRRLFSRAKNKKGKAEEFDQIIAILRAAMRNGQVQSWMYEAMGLTMQLKGMPADEIERALMSAADFTDDPRALLAMADYLSRAGYHDRAVDLYRQVGDVHIHETESFAKTLLLSEYLEDGEAAEWASLGILRRAARRDEMTTWKRAHRTAKARVEELRKSGETNAAEEFETKLAEALKRDLIVVVRWNGDADVDMIVEEPGGTACSFRNPRTSGGGVMMGNLAETLEQDEASEHSQMYVCPEAFAGKYRVMLRQVWGRIPSGRVTVDVFGSNKEGKVGHTQKQISLSENPSLVAFDLPSGRRDESLQQHQLVNDIKTQLAINEVATNRALLAQQITTVAGSEPQSTPRRPRATADPRDPFRGRIPARFGERSSVGYRPVISMLPEGRTLSVNAVVSADRKYVRITALPFFSQIGDVTEFAVGDPGVGTLNQDLVDVNTIEVDADGNIINSENGCIIVDNQGNVVNEEPPCDNVPAPLPLPEPDPAPAPQPVP